MRRGKPCTYLKYGVDYSINTGNFMYYMPMMRINDFIKDKDIQLKCMNVYLQEMTNIHVGQGWDIHWHNGKILPNED
jgi:geranylgeranyl pyrophosphate synthase